MEANIVDILNRSRKTLLEILEDRGYDTAPYADISPDQIVSLSEGNSRALDIVVKKKEDSHAPCDRAFVIFQIHDRIKNKLSTGTFMRDIYDIPPDGHGSNVVTRNDDLIVIYNEPYNEIFDKASLQMWQQNKARMTFFHIKQIVVNPARHVLVPAHRKISADEAKIEMERLHLTQKSQLPLIKHHDMQARILGLVPGDIVEILRPSPTAGISRILRICAA
jgi:hypothetical protein